MYKDDKELQCPNYQTTGDMHSIQKVAFVVIFYSELSNKKWLAPSSLRVIVSMK